METSLLQISYMLTYNQPESHKDTKPHVGRVQEKLHLQIKHWHRSVLSKDEPLPGSQLKTVCVVCMHQNYRVEHADFS